MKKLLSIVIPVYKVEKYIVKCLESLILPNEIMEQVEVIVVNDGTPDRSADMAREYEARFPKTFRVFDKENGGHGSAWNVGLREATGKYVRFLDSDDWLTNLDVFLLNLMSCDADLIFTHLNQFYENTGETKVCKIEGVTHNFLYDANEFEWAKFLTDYTYTDFWYCTYKTSMLKPYQPLFEEHCYYDDAVLFVAPVLFAKTLIFFDITLYNYLLGREGQTVSETNLISHIDDRIITMKPLALLANHHFVEGANRRLYLEKDINFHYKYLFFLLNKLPLKEAKWRIKEWVTFVEKEFPQIEKTGRWQRYKDWPFLIYWIYTKGVNWIDGLHRK